MNFRREKENFRLLLFYSPDPASITALLASLLTSDQYATTEHHSVSCFDSICRGWPVKHVHVMFYSRFHVRGKEKLIKQWAREQANCRLYLYKTVNPVQCFNRHILQATSIAAGVVLKQGVVFEKSLVDVNPHSHSRLDMLESVWEFERGFPEVDLENSVLLQRMNNFIKSGKPFCHAVENIIGILEKRGGLLQFDEHSDRIYFKIDCTEYVCCCFQCAEKYSEKISDDD